jgi:Na+/phosphate symporter
MRKNVDPLSAESLPAFLSFEVAQKPLMALLLFFFSLFFVWFVAKARHIAQLIFSICLLQVAHEIMSHLYNV